MSWLSSITNAAIQIFSSQPLNKPIISGPTTPVEALINTAAPIVLEAAKIVAPPATAALVAPTLQTISTVINDVSHPAAIVQAAQGQVGNIISSIGTNARAAVDDFLINHVGTNNTALVDAGAEALAAAAIGTMSTSGNKSTTDIATALHAFLNGYLNGNASAADQKVADAPQPGQPTN